MMEPFFYASRSFQKLLLFLLSQNYLRKSVEYSGIFQNILIIPRVHWLSVQLIVQTKTGLGKMWLSVKNMYTINSTY